MFRRYVCVYARLLWWPSDTRVNKPALFLRMPPVTTVSYPRLMRLGCYRLEAAFFLCS